MIRNIARGYGNLFSTALRIVVLLVLCSALGAAVVFPLWKFATALPHAYSVTVLSLMAASLVFFLVRRVMRAGAAASVSFALKLAIVAGGIALCVSLVLHARAVLALPALVLMVILYGVVSFGAKKKTAGRAE